MSVCVHIHMYISKYVGVGGVADRGCGVALEI